jgi:UDP-N-acetylglucosamine 2-epimerase (non-hydrolysing)
MIRFERVCQKERPDLVLVVGDVNSTLACALTAAKSHIPVAHVEAGLRSFDLTMPEEINRLLTDHVSEFLFATELSAVKNLKKEGIEKDKIFLIGNVMIDTLLKYKEKALSLDLLKRLRIFPKKYAALTLHRQENVDQKKVFREILQAIFQIQKEIKIIWPLHPRTKKQLRKFGLLHQVKKQKSIILLSPLSYLEMLSLSAQSNLILTDSGGIQEESSFLNVPCLTLRKNTERPITIKLGTNKIVGTKKEDIIKGYRGVIKQKSQKYKIFPKWDGKTAKRIVNILDKNL